MRMTHATQQVLRALLRSTSEPMYGLELTEAAGLQPGTIHPIMARFLKAGWVEAEWEDVDPVAVGRPKRRYYKLTPDGAVSARKELDRVERTTARIRTTLTPGAAGTLA